MDQGREEEMWSRAVFLAEKARALSPVRAGLVWVEGLVGGGGGVDG